MTRCLSLFFFLFLLFPILNGQEGVSFSASADAKQVVIGGYFEVSFTLENANGANFKPPTFKNFTILSGPSQAISTTSINGQWSRTLSYSYSLQPKKIGTFTIGSASILVDKKTLKTKPIKMTVVKGKNSSATTQNDLVGQLEEQVYIKAEPHATDVYIGQQVIVDYKIYTTREVDSYNLLDESAYDGFYAQDIRRFKSQVIREVIDGVQYSTKILKRVALFPQQAGVLTIDQMKIQAAIIADNQPRRRSFFSSPAVTRLQLKTEPLKINARPLPSNAPPSFSGAVGQYTMTSTASHASLTTDDALSIRMTIQGNSDIKQVQAPSFILSDSFEVYDPKMIDESSFTERGGQLISSKMFEYLVLPKYPGTYQLTPEFTYYEVDSTRYQTINANTFSITVRPGDPQKTKTIAAAERGKQEDIRYIKSTTSLQKMGSGFTGSPLFWAFLILPFLVLGSTYTYREIQARKNNIDGDLLKKQRAQKVAQSRLTTAKTFLDQQNSRSFYDEISRALLGYVCDKLNIPLSELTKQNVKGKLASLQVSEQPIDSFMTIIHTCETALYAGMDNAGTMKETYEKAMKVVADIEEEIIG